MDSPTIFKLPSTPRKPVKGSKKMPESDYYMECMLHNIVPLREVDHERFLAILVSEGLNEDAIVSLIQSGLDARAVVALRHAPYMDLKWLNQCRGSAPVMYVENALAKQADKLVLKNILPEPLRKIVMSFMPDKPVVAAETSGFFLWSVAAQDFKPMPCTFVEKQVDVFNFFG